MSGLGKNIRIIEQSGLFDRNWYADSYRDVGILKMDEIEHYLRIGALLGRDPGPGFDSKFYLESNPDVRRHGINPLVHYLMYGSKEGRRPRPTAMGDEQPVSDKQVISVAPRESGGPARRMHVDMQGHKIALRPSPTFASGTYSAEAAPDGPCVVLPHNRADGGRRCQLDVGIHLHVHHIDLLGDIARFLANIPTEFTLYVSVHSDAHLSEASALLAHAVPLARIDARKTSNVGRDIAPFIAEFGETLCRHDLIAHIHTKRSPHNRAKADWRRQLLMNMMGTPGIVRSTFGLFKANPQLGMLFPEYHHALAKQISWGTNFPICQELAAQLGIEISADSMGLFPAGSMFWARPAALRRLLESGLCYEDFPEEAGQVDGTLAHAIERLFGTVVECSGFDLIQSRSDKPHNLMSYYPHKWMYAEPDPDAIRQAAAAYRNARTVSGRRNRIVVFTAVAGGYEKLLPHQNLNSDYDYVAFCDTAMVDCGIWDVRAMDYWSPDPVRMARYVKTHPHKYFPGYDYAIWVDANVVIRGDISGYVELLASQQCAIAGIPHPVRDCIYAEAEAVLAAKKDEIEIVQQQMTAYREAGFPRNAGLIETNFMITDLRHPDSRKVMSGWWAEINSRSRRDQLSLNYVMWRNSSAWAPLMSERRSLRDSFDFAYLGHGRNSGYPRSVLERVGGELVDPFKVATGGSVTVTRPPVDILVCVHNALDDVQQCLQSILSAKAPGDRIVIVDDASGQETADYLDAFARTAPACLIRNMAPAQGYCRAANTAMRAVEAPLFLLLNSDTILTAGALEKMIRLIQSSEETGIVGPLSNAASTQSIPEIKGGPAQTAVNALPDGMSIEDMDAACARWNPLGLFPSVPLVHGFCQLMKKNVIEKIGTFDETSFPNGYGEENDFCFRAADAGFDLKISTDSFVYHRKSASYTDDRRRQELMKNGAEQLRRKHTARRVSLAVTTMEKHPLLVRIRERAMALYAESGVNP